METVIIRSGHRFWYLRSEKEIQDMQSADIEEGRQLDDAGEPRLYSRIGSGRFNDDTAVSITRKRGVGWPHWTKKPSFLVEGLATVNGVPRIVLFQNR